MLRRLRRRRSVWAAIGIGLVVAPALLGGASWAPAQAAYSMPQPELNPLETPPPDQALVQATIMLEEARLVADLVPDQYRLLTVRTAWRHKVDPRLLAAVITVETEWDPNMVGTHGELGLMQILPATGAWLAKKAGLDHYDLADPAINLDLGATYLALLLEQYDTTAEALAAYNGGPQAARSASTNPYARKVLKIYESMVSVEKLPGAA